MLKNIVFKCFVLACVVIFLYGYLINYKDNFFVQRFKNVDSQNALLSIYSKKEQQKENAVIANIGLSDFGVDFDWISQKNLTFVSTEPSKKWTIINVWATWCAPCVNEIPELDDFNLTDKTVPFNMAGITYEAITTRELSHFFTRYFKSKPSYLLYTSQNKPSLKLQNYLNEGMPQTFVFNAEGVLVKRHLGEISSAMLTFEMQALINQ